MSRVSFFDRAQLNAAGIPQPLPRGYVRILDPRECHTFCFLASSTGMAQDDPTYCSLVPLQSSMTAVMERFFVRCTGAMALFVGAMPSSLSDAPAGPLTITYANIVTAIP